MYREAMRIKISTMYNENNQYAIMAVAIVAVLAIGTMTALPEVQAQGSNSKSCNTEGTGFSSFHGCNRPNSNPSNPSAICDSGREFAANFTKGTQC